MHRNLPRLCSRRIPARIRGNGTLELADAASFRAQRNNVLPGIRNFYSFKNSFRRIQGKTRMLWWRMRTPWRALALALETKMGRHERRRAREDAQMLRTRLLRTRGKKVRSNKAKGRWQRSFLMPSAFLLLYSIRNFSQHIFLLQHEFCN